MTTKVRYDYLDALRGWAILGVILTHAASLAGVKGYPRLVTDAAGNGVLLFFVISACTIFMTLTRATDREARPIGNFFIRRGMRLFPVYWFGIILYTVVYGLGSRGWRDGPDLWHYPLHFTLTNLLAPQTMSSVVPGGWSISCEALFYLTVPVWFYFARGLRSALALLVCLMIGGVLCTTVLRHIAGPEVFAAIDPREMKQFWYRLLPSQLGTFGFGIALYFLAFRSPALMTHLQRRIEGLSLLIGGVAVLALATFHKIPAVPSQFSFGLGFMMVALALAAVPFRLLVNRSTIWVGRISYSAYLLHFLVIKQLSLAMPQGAQGPFLYCAALFLLCLPITLVGAWLGYRYLEMPTTRLAARWVAKLEELSATRNLQSWNYPEPVQEITRGTRVH